MWSTRYDDPVPIPTSLRITSVSTEEVVDPTLPLYTFPSSPPALHHSPFGGKGQAKNLKQTLLGRQPKHLHAFQKKLCFFSLFPLLHLGVIGTSHPLVFFLVFFIEDNENVQNGG